MREDEQQRINPENYKFTSDLYISVKEMLRHDRLQSYVDFNNPKRIFDTKPLGIETFVVTFDSREDRFTKICDLKRSLQEYEAEVERSTNPYGGYKAPSLILLLFLIFTTAQAQGLPSWEEHGIKEKSYCPAGEPYTQEQIDRQTYYLEKTGWGIESFAEGMFIYGRCICFSKNWNCSCPPEQAEVTRQAYPF